MTGLGSAALANDDEEEEDDDETAEGPAESTAAWGRERGGEVTCVWILTKGGRRKQKQNENALSQARCAQRKLVSAAHLMHAFLT